jgi:peptidoglycan hydrolase-like protein with peptidoglycan-binding domain
VSAHEDDHGVHRPRNPRRESPPGLRKGWRWILICAFALPSGLHAQPGSTPIPTSVSLSASNSAPTLGNAITLTATVTATAGGSPITSGSVTFYDGPNTSIAAGPDIIGKATILQAQYGVSGSAQLTVVLSAGTHHLTAAYSGTTGALASPNIPVVPVWQPSTTASPVIVTPVGLAQDAFAFYNLEFLGPNGNTTTNPSYAITDVLGYGFQVPEGPVTLNDLTTGG